MAGNTEGRPFTCSLWSRAGSNRTLANTPVCRGTKARFSVVWRAFSSSVVFVFHILVGNSAAGDVKKKTCSNEIWDAISILHIGYDNGFVNPTCIRSSFARSLFIHYACLQWFQIGMNSSRWKIASNRPGRLWVSLHSLFLSLLLSLGGHWLPMRGRIERA